MRTKVMIEARAKPARPNPLKSTCGSADRGSLQAVGPVQLTQLPSLTQNRPAGGLPPPPLPPPPPPFLSGTMVAPGDRPGPAKADEMPVRAKRRIAGPDSDRRMSRLRRV